MEVSTLHSNVTDVSDSLFTTDNMTTQVNATSEVFKYPAWYHALPQTRAKLFIYVYIGPIIVITGTIGKNILNLCQAI